MKILNLYAGIGGNRKLWGDEHEITAVENVEYIANVYAHFYPQDTLILGDAHQYLLDHYTEFDFIWASPPCPTHSKLNTILNSQGHIRYPDMSLYQEIIFLKHFFKGKWVVENVTPYYAALITPTMILDRHFIWANFPIVSFKTGRDVPAVGEWRELSKYYDIVLPDDIVPDKWKRKALRNVADPKIGQHILKAAMHEVKQEFML